ncbi:MAG: hypothetical protein Q8K67_13710 [Geothrix sp.]|nr:hypothetical protein [Geothrix sp.]
MSRRFHRFLLLPCAALVAGALACGGGGGSTPPPPPAAADFSLQVAPGSLQIPAGGSGYITLTLSRLNGFASAVSIAGVGFPAGVVASGTVPVGATTLQLPVVVAAGVTPSVYAGLSLRATAGTLSHDAPFGLTVAQALAPSQLRDDLVQAAGGRQTGGTFENQAIVREGFPALTAKDASDSTRVRHGFYPSGVPADR